MAALNPLSLALFLTVTVTMAGVCQVLWLRSALSKRFHRPIDFGATLRGRRWFGDNKTWRGFVVMVPTTSVLFAAWAAVWPAELWGLNTGGFAVAGAATGLGFMLGELPNSFLKRQLDVPPGEAPAHPGFRRLGYLVDRTDSLIGALVALSLVVPVPWLTWMGCLILGPGIHAFMSFLLYKTGVKKRAA